MGNSFLFLGSGASLGVPVIGCKCAVCKSKDPENKRLRPAALVTYEGRRFLLDCGPDLRMQFLSYGITQIDGMLLTHAHYDHVEGFDELRAFTIQHGKALPTLMSEPTLREMKQRFYYIFENQDMQKMITTKVDVAVTDGERGSVNFLGARIRYFTFEQLGMAVLGFRFRNLAYVSDIKHYPDTIFEDLEGVETLIISALRYSESVMHFTVDEAVEFSRKVKAKRTYLTHISHELDHEEVSASLPESVYLSYDGLKLDF